MSEFIGNQEIKASIDASRIIDALKERPTILKDCTLLTGIQSDQTISSYSGAKVYWTKEGESTGNGKGTFSARNLSPKGLTTKISISKQVIVQQDAMIPFIEASIANAVADELERTILSEFEGSAEKPAGLLSVATEVSGSDILNLLIEAEFQSRTANAKNIKYVVSPSALKKIKLSDDRLYLLRNGLNELPYEVGNFDSVNDLFVLGNWSDLVVAQWGKLDIIQDVYSDATNGRVNLIVNGLFDFKVGRNSFTYGKIE